MVTYGPSDYRSTDGNWSAAIGLHGSLYIGNSAILRFDGRSWTSISVPGSYAVRALACDAQGRVWVGAVDELGYIDEASLTPRFISLRERLPANVPIGAVWNVYALGKRIVFVCEQKILIWDGTAFDIREMPAPRRIFSFRYRDGIVVSQPGVGAFFTDGVAFAALGLAGFEKEEIGWAWDESPTASRFVTSKGTIRRDGAQSAPETGELDTLLRQGLTTSAIELSAGYLCIGTFRSGLVIAERDGRVCRVLDRNSGLPGQDIVAVCEGPNNLLCVVGRRFVALMDSRLGVSTFGPRNGLTLAQTRQVVCDSSGRSLLLTDDAVFAFVPSPRGARWQQLAEGQFLDAAPLGNGVIVLGGLRQIATWHRDTGISVHREVNDILCLAPLGGDKFIASIGTSLRIGSAGPNGPKWDGAEAQFPESVADIAVRGTEIWAATERSGIRVLDGDTLAPLRTFVPGRDFPKDFASPRFVRVGSTWLIRSISGFFTMSSVKPEPVTALAGLQVVASERYVSPEWKESWVVVAEPAPAVDGFSMVRLAEADGRITAIAHPLKAATAVGRPISVQRDPAGALWIVGASGLIRLRAELLTPPAAHRPVLVGAAYLAKGEMHALPESGAWTLPWNMERLTIQFRDDAEPTAIPVLMQSRLRGVEPGWKLSFGEREFSSLSAGAYEFDVRLPGFPTGTTLVALTVGHPWYARPWFVVTGCLVAGVTLWWTVQLRLKGIARRNKELEALVEQRTIELTKAVAAKSAFMGQLGHEIRNPLNGVVGLASRLRGMLAGPRETDIVDRLSSCADQLSSVVEDVLEFSLVDAGKVQLKRRPFHLLEPVQSAIFVCEAAGATKPTLHAADALRTIAPRLGDPDRIRQILANYLENARKYARGSEVSISVTMEGAEHVVFCVSDHGPGIPEAELGQIFERFNRGERARRSGIPGTGLGLAACRAYAAAMGGRVWAESKSNQGASFFLALDLPAATTHDQPAAVRNDRLLEGWSVFVVDDHDYNLFVLSDIVTMMGGDARTAESIAAAMKLFDAAIPDLIFVDLDLGTESGMDLARKIRESRTSHRDVPIIATSAFELDDVREGCLKAGMNAFLSKPITPAKVAAAVQRIERLQGTDLILVAEAPSPAPPNHSYLDFLSGGDPAVYERVLAAARQSLAESARALAAACDPPDFNAIRRYAHSITSAALTVDLSQIASLSRETERCARRGNAAACLANASALLVALRDAGSIK